MRALRSSEVFIVQLTEPIQNSEERKRVAEENKEHKIILPKAGAGDIAHLITRAALSMVPVIGGAAAEVFGATVAPPIAKRRDELIEAMVTKLKELEARIDGLSVEKLVSNQSFMITIVQATTMVIQKGQNEKIEALKNAVLNAALPQAPEESLQLMFLDYIDTFTTWHMKILKFFDNPEEWFTNHRLPFSIIMGAPSSALEAAFPELQGKRSFYDQIVKDLSIRGLLTNHEWLHTGMSQAGMLSSRTSEIGKEFIKFISEPRT
jgi:hypothetical protein